MLLDHCIHMCYLMESSLAVNSYIEVVSEVVQKNPQYSVAPEQILALCIFSLGNDDQSVRQKATRLLRSCEALQSSILRIQEYDIAILDKTKTVHKDAQYGISEKLAQQHRELAVPLFSEFSCYYQKLMDRPQIQRNMVGPMLPWTCNIELQVDSSGSLMGFTHMILMNMFELTMRTGNILHNEINALWLSFGRGPHRGNIQLILDFVMALCLDRMEPRFIEVAKQVVVCLAGTKYDSAKYQIIEYLLLKITPKSMVVESNQAVKPPVGDMRFTYVATLNTDQIPHGLKQVSQMLLASEELSRTDDQQRQMSLGQLALILLVDLVVTPAKVSEEQLPTLLHAVFVLWDHTNQMIQDHAREMLIHVIHELIVSQTEAEVLEKVRQEADKLIESIRSEDPRVIWSLNDSGDVKKLPELQPPKPMNHLSLRVIDLFKVNYPDLKPRWNRVAVQWATNCPVRSIARKSLQVYRCIVKGLDNKALPDILERLSNTVADSSPELQSFSLEILATLGTIITKIPSKNLGMHPQLFWTVCACLESPNQEEFAQGLLLLEQLIPKMDLSDEKVCGALLDARPAHWSGGFDGVQQLIYPGLRSSVLFDRTISVLQLMVGLPDHPLLGRGNRATFLLLAIYPLLVQPQNDPTRAAELRSIISELQKILLRMGCQSFVSALQYLQDTDSPPGKEFTSRFVEAVRMDLLPQGDFSVVTFLLGLLTNNTDWIRQGTLQLLNALIPHVDLKKRVFAEHGVDLISPLLFLLDTDQCMQALDVLDKISMIPSVANDRQHLRRSVIGLGAHKNYDSAPSLFGSPESDGWAAPAPRRQSDTTRANIRAIYHHAPAHRSAPGSHRPLNSSDLASPSETSGSIPGYSVGLYKRSEHVDPSNITGRLDDLELFLTHAKHAMLAERAGAHAGRHGAGHGHGHGHGGHSGSGGSNGGTANQTSPYTPLVGDRRDEIYDREVYPILATLQRQPSSASVYLARTESRPSTSSGSGPGSGTVPSIQSAITSATSISISTVGTGGPPSAAAAAAAQRSQRPVMALRALTSPVKPATAPSFQPLSPFADSLAEADFPDQNEPFPSVNPLGTGTGLSSRLGHHEGSLSADDLISLRGATAATAASRSLTARKLTSGSGRERERDRERERELAAAAATAAAFLGEPEPSARVASPPLPLPLPLPLPQGYPEDLSPV